MNNSGNINQLVDHLFREEYGKVVSYLTSIFGFHFLESAQDIAQDTLTEAYQNWSYRGVPNNPKGWIYRVAKNKAINWVKREQKKHEVYREVEIPEALTSDEISTNYSFQDSMLNMILACCHSEITIENQIALILNILCGFSRKEIANALLTKEETIKKRLFRAKKQVREQKLISIDKDQPIQEVENKLQAVCMAIYLLFNEGYNSSHKDELIRKDLCLESIRLTKILLEKYPHNTRIQALMATMCFHVARFSARIDNKGAIILLEDQDRNLWNGDFIKKGLYHLSEAAKGNDLTSYHLEASIAAQHCLAKDFESTNWVLIYRFYQLLYQLKPSPIIQLNLAIVSGMMEGGHIAIAKLNRLKEESKTLQNYYLLYAALGHFYLKRGQKKLALANFEKAKRLTSSPKELELLERKIDFLALD